MIVASTGIAAPTKKFSSLMKLGLIVVSHRLFGASNVVVLTDGAAGSNVTRPFGSGYAWPFNTNDAPVNSTVVFVVAGTSFGLKWACTQTTGAVPNGTLNLFQ